MNTARNKTTLCIRNARIVSPKAVLEGMVVVIEGDAIKAIVPEKDLAPDSNCIDAGGAWLMPGFIDIHADYIEHMAAPRPSCLMDFRIALGEAEKELISHGITTMFHSLSFYRESEFGNKPVRLPENVKKLIGVIDAVHKGSHLVRHRFHGRLEIDCLSAVDFIKEYIAAGSLHLLSFMDHTPGQGQYRNLEIFRETLKGYRNLENSEIDKIIDKHQQKEVLSLDQIRELAQFAQAHGIAIASHDDDSVDKIALVKSFGAGISEFPITMEVAKAAKEQGLATVAGAPNILLGGSHSGNLNAADAIKEGLIDILCSDYYPAAMLHSIFRMVREHGRSMPEMVALLTCNPARACGLGEVLGSIAPGLKADLLLVNELDDGFPAINMVIVDGVIVSQNQYRRTS